MIVTVILFAVDWFPARNFGDGLKVLCAKPIHRGVFQMTMFEYIFTCPQFRHAMAIPFLMFPDVNPGVADHHGWSPKTCFPNLLHWMVGVKN